MVWRSVRGGLTLELSRFLAIPRISASKNIFLNGKKPVQKVAAVTASNSTERACPHRHPSPRIRPQTAFLKRHQLHHVREIRAKYRPNVDIRLNFRGPLRRKRDRNHSGNSKRILGAGRATVGITAHSSINAAVPPVSSSPKTGSAIPGEAMSNTKGLLARVYYANQGVK